jgi:hypothetical protein
MSDLPEGFVLDAPTPPTGGLPDGFVLDSAAPVPPKPFGLGDTWPARLAKSIVSGLTLPGDVYAGRASPDDTARVMDLATIASPVNPAVRSGDFAIPGLARRVAPEASPAAQVAQSAENIGVDLPKAIASDSQLARFTGQVLARAPGGGPLQEGIRSAVGQTGEAVARAADMAGGSTDAATAGAAYRGGIESSFKPAVKARVSAAYDQVEKLTNPNVTTPLDSTQGAIADIVARRQASGEEDPGKAIKTVLGGATRPGGLTFAGVKDLRTRVGEMLDTGVFPEGMSQAELRRMYGSLSDDLQSAARNAGGEPAVQALARANIMAKTVADWKSSLGKVLGTDTRSDEGVAGAIVRLASNGPTGDLATLAKARAAAPKEVWQDVASTAISNLGRSRTGEWSPAAFRSDFNNLSDRGKSLLFGSVGQHDLLPFLSDIAKVSQKFVDAGKLANTSGTAGHSAAYAIMGSAATGALHGSLIEPIAAVSGIVGMNMMSRVLATKATAASMARWSRAYDAVASNPTPNALAVFNIVSRNLAGTINGHLGGNVAPGDFLKAIQGPTRGSADEHQAQ